MFDMDRAARRGATEPEAEVADEIPAGWLEAFEREAGTDEAGHGSRLRGLRHPIIIGAVVFDLVLLAFAYAIYGAIGRQGAGSPTTTNLKQGREMMVLGTVLGVVLLVSAAVGLVLRMPGMALVQSTLLVITCLVAVGVAEVYDSQPPSAPSTPVSTPGHYGYCSGGHCHGWATQEG